MPASSPALVKQARLFALRTRAEKRAMPLDVQLRAAGLPPPILEFQFDSQRQWAFDLAWPYWRIAFEQEGGMFINGRHTRGRGYERDCEKYNRAAILGWLLIRASPGMVARGEAIRDLVDAFSAKGLE